jgi:dihydrofolate reductase
MAERKVILYIACSLDGYIAKPNDDLSFLDIVKQDGEDYGYNEFIATVDTVILGRKTYDWVIKQVKTYPDEGKEVYVITSTDKPKEGRVNFYSGNLKELVSDLKEKGGQHIFCNGGATIVNELLQYRLIDEIIISVIPVLVGRGTKLFKEGQPEQNLTLISSKKFVTGLVQLHYKIQ